MKLTEKYRNLTLIQGCFRVHIARGNFNRQTVLKTVPAALLSYNCDEMCAEAVQILMLYPGFIVNGLQNAKLPIRACNTSSLHSRN